MNGFGLNTLLQESKQIPKHFVMDTATVKRTETIANSNPNPARTRLRGTRNDTNAVEGTREEEARGRGKEESEEGTGSGDLIP